MFIVVRYLQHTMYFEEAIDTFIDILKGLFLTIFSSVKMQYNYFEIFAIKKKPLFTKFQFFKIYNN